MSEILETKHTIEGSCAWFVHVWGDGRLSLSVSDDKSHSGMWIPLEFEDKLFTILSRRKYERQEPMTVTCPTCNGSREVMVQYADSTAETPFTACPNCLDGTIALPDPIEPMDEAA